VVLFLHDNVPFYRALSTQKKLTYLGFQCLDHLPYSPDLAPSDYHVFPGLNESIVRNFSSNTEIISVAETWLDGKSSEIFEWLEKLQQRAKKSIDLRGEYVK
jgi:histone-lysine N-methyltransferase SETMAR